MKAANPWRGEVAVHIAGKLMVLRPSFEALAAIEAELSPILSLAQSAGEGMVRLKDMAAVFHHCLMPDENGDKPDRNMVGEAVAGMGLAEAIAVYRRLLETVLKGTGGAQ